ncbi:hypothetical protein [Mesorhizobium loti]|uniref:Uncharacterized protein n=1 Tax=Mesorhizobium loti R88b TaxID=935548 RepID=A0A6M7WFX0_RHILI|nr:hypothetical protein [Mesorhizobium loti]QKD02720.1 hypothetical protein EB235_15415 [Mesorhizobium loti R88b]
MADGAKDDTKPPAGAWGSLWSALQFVTKLVATLIAALALIGFFVPPLGKLVNVVSAWRFGAAGYVYYGVRVDGEPSGGGQLYVLRSGPVNFRDINWGERLQAVSGKEFRETASPTGRQMFELNKGDCVVVLGKGDEVTDPERLKGAASGGWLYVATTACGLFK